MDSVVHRVATPNAVDSPPARLQGAFGDFIAASARLERSYRELQSEVAELNLARGREQKELNESRNEQDRLLSKMEQIFCAVPAGLILMNDRGEVLQANPEAARILALAATQMPSAAVFPRSAPGIVSGSPLSSRSHEAELDEEILEVVSSEGRQWIVVRRILLERVEPAQGASTLTWLLTLQDITARKTAELERERARDAAALAGISALLAHEIRNPLASMELFADLLTQLPERSAEWTSHLRAGIRSLASTVNNVLLLSVEDAPPAERLNLAAEIPPVLEFLQPLALQAEVNLRYEGPTGPWWVQGNRTSLHQLLLNLCTNAFRYTPHAGHVFVSCAEGPQGLTRLSVRDTGAGILPERLQTLFAPGVTDSRQRTGLGLAVCDRLMRQHGGRIHVSSTPGVGSIFTLEFLAA